MLEVWGRRTSSNVQAVMWCAAELGLEVERHDRGHAFGGLDAPEYRAMNPHGKVPTARDAGGPAMWESAAIVRYLAARYGDEAFWPADPGVRAQQDMWAEWWRSAVAPLFTSAVFWPRIRSGGAAPDAAADAAAAEAMAALIAPFDARLGESAWLGGDAPSWADVICGSLMHRWMHMDWPRPEAANLAAWHARLEGRAAFREHVMVDWSVLMTPAG